MINSGRSKGEKKQAGETQTGAERSDAAEWSGW